MRAPLSNGGHRGGGAAGGGLGLLPGSGPGPSPGGRLGLRPGGRSGLLPDKPWFCYIEIGPHGAACSISSHYVICCLHYSIYSVSRRSSRSSRCSKTPGDLGASWRGVLGRHEPAAPGRSGDAGPSPEGRRAAGRAADAVGAGRAEQVDPLVTAASALPGRAARRYSSRGRGCFASPGRPRRPMASRASRLAPIGPGPSSAGTPLQSPPRRAPCRLIVPSSPCS